MTTTPHPKRLTAAQLKAKVELLEAEISNAHTILDAQGTSSDVGSSDFPLATRICALVGMLTPKHEYIISTGNTSNVKAAARRGQRTRRSGTKRKGSNR